VRSITSAHPAPEAARDSASATRRLWGDLPAEDLSAAGRVLRVVLERANRELAGA
jgi:hypothetical protein